MVSGRTGIPTQICGLQSRILRHQIIHMHTSNYAIHPQPNIHKQNTELIPCELFSLFQPNSLILSLFSYSTTSISSQSSFQTISLFSSFKKSFLRKKATVAFSMYYILPRDSLNLVEPVAITKLLTTGEPKSLSIQICTIKPRIPKQTTTHLRPQEAYVQVNSQSR